MVKLLLCIPGSITSTFAKASPIFPYPPLHRAGCGLQQWCAESQDHFSYVCLMMLVRRELCGHRHRCHVMARTCVAVVSPKYWSLSIRNFLYVSQPVHAAFRWRFRTLRKNEYIYIFSFLLLSHQSVCHRQTLPGGDQQ